MSDPQAAAIAAFVERWRGSAGAERANKDSFLNDLCAAIGVPAPDPTTGDAKRDHYVFEKAVQVSTEKGKTTMFIDLYKRGSFVLEAKQGSESNTGKLGTAKRDTPTWNVAMNAAFGQAIDYANALDEPPPFVIVTDIGYCFDVYASFDGSARYRPFPNALSHRFFLTRITERADTLRSIFTDPLSLDPAKVAVEVTREVASHLADLTRRLEKAGHAPQSVADFLMRCIFTMFAEDVGLLPEEMFTTELRNHWIKSPRSFTQGVENLWRAMNDGSVFGFFGRLLHFNGGLFKSPAALPLDKGDLEVLLEAASCRWNKVEPAIFGALFEGALDKKERHSLGAHFTPRAYVERLVRPTIEEPIREYWTATQEKIRSLASNNKIKEAKAEARGFMKRLSEIRVLDPACGSGNFLYVALDLLKAVEDEAFALLLALEGGQTELCLDASEVTPRQFLGIEVNPRAKAIAELVLWIGYLQWHFRTKHRGGKPREPVLEDYKNVDGRDAILSYQAEVLVRDERTGKPLTSWDGVSMKRHAVTDKLVPDERFTVPLFAYEQARRAEWPAADFIVGNPPFVGNKRMRATLGDGYVAALRSTYDDLPDTIDWVMYWWNRAAQLVQIGRVRRAGLITTNSITQTFNREIVRRWLGNEVSLHFAVADHPWVDTVDGAAVRIAMTVVAPGSREGTLLTVGERDAVVLKEEHGLIHSDLTIGAPVTSARQLKSNSGLAFQGMALCGDGFILTRAEAEKLLTRPNAREVVHRYRNGRDVARKNRDVFVIDFYGLAEDDAQTRHPREFQIVLDRVKPERDQQRREARKRKYWLFGEVVPGHRRATVALPRYIATCRTAKHRVFVFLEADIVPDAKLIAIALSDGYSLAVLSSRVHTIWAERAGAFLGVGNDPNYNHSACFATFPFPEKTSDSRYLDRLGDALEKHRRARQEECPALTLTDVYNVLEKVRGNEALDERERLVHERALVGILAKIHNGIDVGVFDAYGWPHDLSDEEILERLVSLNAKRVEEEKNGDVRWLRPEFQVTAGAATPESAETVEQDTVPARASRKGPGIKSTRPEPTKVRRRSGGKG